MAIEREAALKKAEKFLRQGKLDGAIEEYVRLVEEHPRDWNAINALGDLYARAGATDKAVEQFTRIADYLFAEGFFPKAAALYKKSLKVNSAHEPTLQQLGEIAIRQGLLADAKTHLKQLAEQKRKRGDERGAAETLIRLATLDEADTESQIGGARAAQQIGETVQAARLLRDAAAQLTRQDRKQEALDLLVEAARLDPASVGDDPDVLLALARAELKAGRDDEAKALLMRVLTVASDRHDDVLQFGLDLAREERVDRVYPCIELLADASLLDGQWQRAAADLRVFGEQLAHVPALMRLVEICVDAGDDEGLRGAQALLADAYLREGRGAEARVIAEDLVQHDPSSQAHQERLRAALQLLGVADIETIIAERLNPDAAIAMLSEELDLLFDDLAPPAPDVIEIPELSAPVDHHDEPGDDHFVLDTVEIDLSTALASMDAAPPPLPKQPTPAPAPVPVPLPAPAPAPAVSSAPAAPPRDLESVFEEMRAKVEREQQSSSTGAQYERGLAHLREGRTEEAIADLRAAARTPLFRFKAAADLGRLYVSGGHLQTGIEWFERAAEAPAPTPDEGFAVLYDLAAGLEQLGETARALAVLLELEADAGGYRDVRTRISALTREQAGSRGA